MIKFNNNGILIETQEELDEIRPLLMNSKNLYLDVETTSGDSQLMAVNPWHNCNLLGICILVDHDVNSYYIPCTLNYKKFLKDVISSCDRWINHNIKFDAHCVSNDLKWTLPERIEYIDTLTSAKIIDSDRWQYGLKILSKDWLHDDISHHEERMEPYLGRKSKDYGDVPVDIIAEYGCQDVLTERKLYKYIDKHMPNECRRIYQIEKRLTYILYRVEKTGFKVDTPKIVTDGFQRIPKLLRRISDKLEDLTGGYINPTINSDCYKLLCGQYGLPVLETTEAKEEPSFGKDAMVGYLQLAKDDPYLYKVIKLMRTYKRFYKIHTSFTLSYLKLLSDGCYLHCSYNQMVRTGRMSAQDPNMQQLPHYVKYYVIPEEGHYIVSIDLSQIEFRIITHYINQPDIITAYNNNPNTDFHQQVADMCGIGRKPAKTVNFLTGYGGGKFRLRQEFLKQPALAAESLPEGVDFQEFCKEKADEVHAKYHEQLSNLKPTMQRAMKTLRQRRYVKTLYGRHRHLPLKVWSKEDEKWYDQSYKSFNTVCQGSAADLFKDITCRLWDLLQNSTYKTKMIGLVHDDFIFQIPKNEIKEIVPQLVLEIERDCIDLRVPIRCEVEYSDKNWGSAKSLLVMGYEFDRITN